MDEGSPERQRWEDALPDRAQGPPFSITTESALLGALLYSTPTELLDELFRELSVEDFYVDAHARIYEAMIALSPEVKRIDLVTVANYLQQRNLLDKVGGSAYLASLTSGVLGSANLLHYARMLRGLGLRRRLQALGRDMQGMAVDYSKPPAQILETSERRILELSDRLTSQNEFRSAADVVHSAIEGISERYQQKGELTGITSGFHALDRFTLGFHNSEMIIVGARPSVGKTAFALSMATSIANHHRIPCGFFTLEMNAMSLMHRILSAEARVDSRLLRCGLLQRDDWARLTQSAEHLYEAPLFIDDSPNIRLLELRSRARRMVRLHQVKIIFIDYIGLISVDDKSIPRHEQVADISMNLKALARELNIPIVALSQVGRQSEGRAPGMADLRGSGALEQDADMILYLHRERSNESFEQQPEFIETELQIAKQRNGPVGNIKILFRPSFSCFVSPEHSDSAH